MSKSRILLLLGLIFSLFVSSSFSLEPTKAARRTLDFYLIDSEGGAATLTHSIGSVVKEITDKAIHPVYIFGKLRRQDLESYFAIKLDVFS